MHKLCMPTRYISSTMKQLNQRVKAKNCPPATKVMGSYLVLKQTTTQSSYINVLSEHKMQLQEK